jgi:hypothetical protein
MAAVLAVALAGVVAATARALAFDDATPCPVTIDNGQGLFVCPQGTVGTGYSVQLVARGGCEPSFVFLVVNGGLPGGLSMSSSGLISGTPTGAGSARFWVKVHDIGPAEGGPVWCTFPKDAEREFTITIHPRMLITTEAAAPGTVGVPYNLPVVAQMMSGPGQLTAPSSPVSWSVQGALPPGLALGADGVITGSPTTEGAYSFVVRAALADGRADTKGLTINIRQPLAIAPSRPLTASATATSWEVGVPFSSKLVASGGTGTYTWSVAEGTLPTGFALAADGTLAGTTRTAGSYRATLRLADSEGRTADYAANFLVAPRLTVSTVALRPAKVGRLYRARVAAAGGVAPKAWKIVRGPLPRGIRFDRKLGLLSGTPTKAGRYRVRFQVTDGLRVVAVKTLRIDVLGPPA